MYACVCKTVITYRTRTMYVHVVHVLCGYLRCAHNTHTLRTSNVCLYAHTVRL